jgi:hypothetical protein
VLVERKWAGSRSAALIQRLLHHSPETGVNRLTMLDFQ